jgi:hypothetical protein
LDAYVLIQTQPGAGPVAGDLAALPGILTAEEVSGPYDVIALARSASTQDLYGSLIDRIRRVPGVTHALPAPLVRPMIHELPAEDQLQAVPAA